MFLSARYLTSSVLSLALVVGIFGVLSVYMKGHAFEHMPNEKEHESILQTTDLEELTKETDPWRASPGVCVYRAKFALRDENGLPVDGEIEMWLFGYYPEERLFSYQARVRQLDEGYYAVSKLFDCTFEIETISTSIEADGYYSYSATEKWEHSEANEIILRLRL